MAISDRRGLEITADDKTAVAHYEAAVEHYLGFRPDTVRPLKAALEAEPTLFMAQVLQGYFYLLMANAALEPKVAKTIAGAAPTANRVSARERVHLAALEAWHKGDLPTATARWEAILIDHPRDILALKLAHFTHFYLGDTDSLRDSIARVSHAWDEAVPGYGFVLGMYAFGLEEGGEYAAAERTGRHAVALNPADIWAVHSVAHVMEMQGRHREGMAWLDTTREGWRGCNNFTYHLWWHWALYHLELRQHDAALALYDRAVREDRSDFYLDIVNAASLLWRLELLGVDVGERWQELAETSATRIHDRMLAFVDTHFIMALAGAGERATARRMFRAQRGSAADATTTAAAVTAAVGLPVAQALLAYRDGDYGRVVDLLIPLRNQFRRLGGSHAQRDVFTLTLIEASLRAGRFTLARGLLAERTARRPKSAPSWEGYARALDGLGDASAAAAARATAAALVAA
ncbi:MAG: tetratricopeptide repeat protein [Kiloniellales bacterium]